MAVNDPRITRLPEMLIRVECLENIPHSLSSTPLWIKVRLYGIVPGESRKYTSLKTSSSEVSGRCCKWFEEFAVPLAKEFPEDALGETEHESSRTSEESKEEEPLSFDSRDHLHHSLCESTTSSRSSTPPPSDFFSSTETSVSTKSNSEQTHNEHTEALSHVLEHSLPAPVPLRLSNAISQPATPTPSRSPSPNANIPSKVSCSAPSSPTLTFKNIDIPAFNHSLESMGPVISFSVMCSKWFGFSSSCLSFEQDAVIPLCSLPWNSCKQLEFNISWISEPNAHEYSPAVLRVTITKKHAGEMHSTLFSPGELRIPKKLPSMYIMLNSPTFSDKDVVKGKLVINTTNAFRIEKSLEVVVSGAARTRVFRDDARQLQGETVSRLFRKTFSFLDECPTSLPPGHHEWLFSYRLPHMLPSSVSYHEEESCDAQIKYLCECLIDQHTPAFNDAIVRVPFAVCASYSPHDCVVLECGKTLGLPLRGIVSRHNVLIEANFENSLAYIGDIAVLRYIVVNNTNLDVHLKHVSFTHLIRIEARLICTDTNSNEAIENTSVSRDIENSWKLKVDSSELVVEALKSREFDLRFKIPNDAIPSIPTTALTTFHVSYYANSVFDVGGKALIEVKTPVCVTYHKAVAVR